MVVMFSSLHVKEKEHLLDTYHVPHNKLRRSGNNYLQFVSEEDDAQGD